MNRVETNGDLHGVLLAEHPAASEHSNRRVTLSDWWHGRSVAEEVARLEARVAMLEWETEVQALALEQAMAITCIQTTLAVAHAKAIDSPRHKETRQ